jgi:hypothetical protein
MGAMMIENTLAMLLNMPGMMLIIGALAVPLLPSSIGHGYMLAVIAVSGWSAWQMSPDQTMTATLAGIDLILVRGRSDNQALRAGLPYRRGTECHLCHA